LISRIRLQSSQQAACQEDAATFNAGHGGCESYDETLGANNMLCSLKHSSEAHAQHVVVVVDKKESCAALTRRAAEAKERVLL